MIEIIICSFLAFTVKYFLNDAKLSDKGSNFSTLSDWLIIAVNDEVMDVHSEIKLFLPMTSDKIYFLIFIRSV